MTEIVITGTDKQNGNLQNVYSGETFEAFLQSKKATKTKRGLTDVGACHLRSSTTDVLNHCNPHDSTSSLETTHLVVGYVQSGKTMSFTGVLAMARDNGYRFAIVLTGTITNLLEQTSERLEKDLGLSENFDWFRFFTNPSTADVSSIVGAFRLSDKPLIVIPILKHAKYIKDVADIFSNEKVQQLIKNETVLIIDDEADQASLNSFGNKNSKNMDADEDAKFSATYAAILKMRSQLPGNSYIQYTATPQANILITTADFLSPKSHTLLTPGEDYVGGKKFFGQENNGDLFNGQLVKKIPDKEVYHKKDNVLVQMPPSLREALIMHVWAVLLVIKWYHRPRIKQLSMLIHPTDIIEGNKIFEKWVNDEISYWSDCFVKPEGHEDRVLLLNKFKKFFPDAISFYSPEGRPSFDDVKRFIPDIINDCVLYRITGDSDDDGKKINWESHRMNILVGAQKLNRGFTVENLATTYMPRYATSITNADTIEQRCRFFGYKMDYIESCRVYLPKKSISDYISYVKHEEELRALLSKSSNLKEYEHRVMLSPSLRPTRINVLPHNIVKTKLVDWTKYEKISGGKMIADNRKVVSGFIDKYLSKAGDFSVAGYKSSKYADGETKKHKMFMSPANEIISLLADYLPGSYSETLRKSMTLRYIQYLDSIQQGKIMTIFMSGGCVRHRTLDSDKQEVVLFQGRSNIDEKDDYCGDTNIFSKDYITLQIHHICIDGTPVSEVNNRETYALAFHFPEKLKAIYCSSIESKFDIEDE